MMNKVNRQIGIELSRCLPSLIHCQNCSNKLRGKEAWQDALHHQEDIVRLRRQQIARHAVDDMEAVVIAHTQLHLTPRLGVMVVAVGVAVADQAAVLSHAGQNLAHLYRIHLLKFNHLNQFEKRLRREQFSSLIFVMYFYVMLGVTAK
jgi:hypothetical protein